jgi:phosphate starvation-inducible protein PhoH and related proteins
VCPLEADPHGWTEIEVSAPEQLSALVGPFDEHLRAVQRAFGVRAVVRELGVRVESDREGSEMAEQVLRKLLATVQDGHSLSAMDVEYAINAIRTRQPEDADALRSGAIWVTARGRRVRPRTAGQAAYVEAMARDDLVLAIGPAGTGKTYLAMAVAVASLRAKSVTRIVLTRPILEAGEHLGFLPGDIQEKVDPYLRPLYDALYDLIGLDKFQRHLDRGTLELAPLAYMRGRTLNDAFVVLDEAQNTSIMQMKMLLTRLGFGSRMVVTGDTTQIDLPSGQLSGLVHAQQVLKGLPGVSVCELSELDIVRHPLVQRIVKAYDRAEPGDAAHLPGLGTMGSAGGGEQ